MTAERFYCDRNGLVDRSACGLCFAADAQRAATYVTRAICASAHGRWLDEGLVTQPARVPILIPVESRVA